jgi:hypothetical protein
MSRQRRKGIRDQKSKRIVETIMLVTLCRSLKTVAIAGLMGIGLAGTGAVTPASADTIRTRCFGDDCYRQQCDDFGYDCVNIGYEGYPDYQAGQWERVCDADHCDWARIYDEDRPYGYDRPYDYDQPYNYDRPYDRDYDNYDDYDR